MSTLFQVVNLTFLVIGVLGYLFLLYAIWRIMRSTKVIEETVKNIESNIKSG